MHLILFDIDGTLIRGRGFGRRALERAFEDVFGVEAEDLPSLRAVPFAGNSDPRIIAAMAQVLGVPSEVYRPRMEEFLGAYLAHLRVTVTESDSKEACPGVTELLPDLHVHPGITLGLLTGNIEPGARVKLEPFGFNRYFPFGGFGDDGEDRPAMALCAVARAEEHARVRFEPERVLVIGDTEADVNAGRAHGFRTAAVATGWTPLETLEATGATRVFPDLSPRNGFGAWLRESWLAGAAG